jgi:dihydroxyacetone kinase-like predicted kinase
VLEEAIKYGSLLTVKIENMKKQHSELTAEIAKAPSFSKKYGFVAVANGDGICDVFRDLGVDEMVIGGQTMNPSTDDILAAINKVDAENVYVLPNNSNIIMVAQQAAAVASESGKNVNVIRSKSVPQGISAMYAFDEEFSSHDNTAAMSTAISGVCTLSVTYAVRDASVDGLEIKEGQYLGLVENKVKKVSEALEDCLSELCAELSGKDCITVFYGEGVDETDIEKYASIIEEKLGDDVDITYISGGQPIYSFIISGE